MLQNNIKIAIRQLFKYKFYSLINIGGLAISVACSILIILYIHNEWSYDRFHKNANHIYRLALDVNLNQSVAKGIAMPAPLAPTLKEEFPEVENAARMNVFFRNAGNNIVRVEGQEEGSFQEGFVYIDQAFTEIFDFNAVAGDPSSWLKEPNTVIITEKIAKQFFPDQDPMGKSLLLNESDQQQYRISGVIEAFPDNSHLQYDYFMSMPTLGIANNNNWISNNYFTYIQLKENADPEALNAKLFDFGLKYFGPQFREQLDIDLADRSSGQKYDLFIQALSDIHLYSKGFIPYIEGGDIRYVRLFGAVAIFLIIIAIANFVNLYTARSAKRAKEIGMRKVLGSRKGQLVRQFLVESILVTTVAFLGGLLLAFELLPLFNQITELSLVLPFSSLKVWAGFLLSLLLLGLLAGLYPAFYLSGFQPLKVLKGKLSLGASSKWLRKSLVLIQFTISSALIFATLVVYSQMQFIQNRKIGFEKDQVILIHDTNILGDRIEVLKREMNKWPETESVSLGAFLPLQGGFRNQTMFNWEKNTTPEAKVPIQAWQVDADYINTLQIKLLEGRNFDPQRPNDANAVLLNQKAIDQLGIEGDPVGQRIESPFGDNIFTIIGVVDNFHFESLREEINGLGLFLGRNTFTVAARVGSQNMNDFIQKLESTWQSFVPQKTLRYSFLDERFDKMYSKEKQAATLFNFFTTLAIFIACLGLLALATYTTEQRSKEIGIRKVLGASAIGIVRLLSSDFLILVFISLILATPLAYFYTQSWLENFVYRVEVQWWVYLFAIILALGAAFITVSFQGLRAALMNPVDAIKSE